MADGDEHLGKAADPAKVREQARQAKTFEAREDDDLFMVLSTRQGRRWIWSLLGFCRENQLSFAERNHDQTCFNEGMRNVGLMVKARIMRVDPDLFIKMSVEAKEDEVIKHG